MTIRNFVIDISDEEWSKLDIKSSPARKLSDLFWLKLPWALIKSELGQINVLDTGCGAGNYGVRLQSYSKGSMTSYTGLDIARHDNWDSLMNKYQNFRFHALNSAHILEHLPAGTNFFVTQSAVEHFDEDLLYFEQIRDFILRESSNVIQIHLLPASACLQLYLCHGVRQYTPRTISKITRIFNKFSYSVLFGLGGQECNALHREFITRPIYVQKVGDLRDTKTQEYDRRLREAIKADMKKPQKSPSFYALVIHSNWKTKIFHD